MSTLCLDPWSALRTFAKHNKLQKATLHVIAAPRGWDEEVMFGLRGLGVVSVFGGVCVGGVVMGSTLEMP